MKCAQARRHVEASAEVGEEVVSYHRAGLVGTLLSVTLGCESRVDEGNTALLRSSSGVIRRRCDLARVDQE